MNLPWGGTSGTPDYMGVDLTWFAGSSFARPVFDNGGSGGYSGILTRDGISDQANHTSEDARRRPLGLGVLIE
jgi:hypothetical protein